MDPNFYESASKAPINQCSSDPLSETTGYPFSNRSLQEIKSLKSNSGAVFSDSILDGNKHSLSFLINKTEVDPSNGNNPLSSYLQVDNAPTTPDIDPVKILENKSNTEAQFKCHWLDCLEMYPSLCILMEHINTVHVGRRKKLPKDVFQTRIPSKSSENPQQF
ncbi:hypothetical protein BB560_000917 [Smittium megazygosporum]|uniref:C2H2-type domain-containing protein n=1 Tax=Smittium megazygosporum TaxID=133381 RepID=A0A2T9XYE4_9FUNG|nr:hypothetical protein BB560_007142 [Smittium megazygosporum]PVV04583.1 hypothetical protein BB560_000917 [Smittium megazygosporum]